VINFDQVAPALHEPPLLAADGVRRYLLCQNRYFVTERIELAAGATFSGECDGRTCEIWGAINGAAQVNDLPWTPCSSPYYRRRLGLSVPGAAPATLRSFTQNQQRKIAAFLHTGKQRRIS
jgi:hypothetical protein